MTTNFNSTQTISNSSNTQTWNFDRQLAGGDTIFLQKNILDSSNTAGNFIEKVSRSNGSTVQDVYYVEESTIRNAALWRKQFVTNTGATYSPLTIIKGNNSNPLILLDADINLNNKKITNSASPTNSTDLVNKNYVDTKGLNTLPVAGDLDLGTYRAISSATPTSGSHLVNKTYVDEKIDPTSIHYCIFSSGTSTTQCVQYNNTTVDFISGFNTKLAKNASFISFDNGGLFTVTQNGLYKIEVSGRIQDGGGTNASTGVGVYIDDTINIVECWIPADGDGRRSFMASTLPFLAPNQNIRIKINQIGSANALRINFITLSITKLQ